MAKGLSYEELIEYARAHYAKGGDAIFECWDKRVYDEYVSLFGPISKRKALWLFRINYEEEREAAANCWW